MYNVYWLFGNSMVPLVDAQVSSSCYANNSIELDVLPKYEYSDEFIYKVPVVVICMQLCSPFKF